MRRHLISCHRSNGQYRCTRVMGHDGPCALVPMLRYTLLEILIAVGVVGFFFLVFDVAFNDGKLLW